MLSLVIKLLGAVILTIGVESLIVIPRFLPHSSNKKRLIANVLLINVITNVTLNLILAVVGAATTGNLVKVTTIIIGELLIPLVEANMYKMGELQMARKRVIAICYLANALSFGIGMLWGMMV